MLLVTWGDSHTIKVTGMLVGKLQLNLSKSRTNLALLSFYLTLKETKLQQNMSVFSFSYGHLLLHTQPEGMDTFMTQNISFPFLTP